MKTEDRNNSSSINVHMCKIPRVGRMKFWLITRKEEETVRDDSQGR